MAHNKTGDALFYHIEQQTQVSECYSRCAINVILNTWYQHWVGDLYF